MNAICEAHFCQLVVVLQKVLKLQKRNGKLVIDSCVYTMMGGTLAQSLPTMCLNLDQQFWIGSIFSIRLVRNKADKFTKMQFIGLIQEQCRKGLRDNLLSFFISPIKPGLDRTTNSRFIVDINYLLHFHFLLLTRRHAGLHGWLPVIDALTLLSICRKFLRLRVTRHEYVCN